MIWILNTVPTARSTLTPFFCQLEEAHWPLGESPSAWRHRICEATPDTSCRMYSESTEIVLYKLATMLLDIDI